MRLSNIGAVLLQSLLMIDPSQIEVPIIVQILNHALSAAFDWVGRLRKKPAPAEVKKKVAELVSEAADTLVPTGALSAEDKRHLVADIAQVSLPTFEQIVHYSPNTQRVIRAAKKGRGPARRVAPKFLVKKASAKRTARKASKRR